MNLFGFQLTVKRAGSLRAVSDDERGWVRIFDVMRGSNGQFTGGAFQKDLPSIDPCHAQRNWTVFACETLIAGDAGKLRMQLVEEDPRTGIYEEVSVPAFSPLLRKPNGYQTWQKFIESWVFSKLGGNAYIFKDRDNRNVVKAMHVLDAYKVTPLVAPNGEVYYQLGDDDLAQVPEGIPPVPASEIIHDRMWCLFHPLVGISPLFASGLAALQGLDIQSSQQRFFANQSQPSGILIAPGAISDKRAGELKAMWEKFRQSDRGGTAVLGDDLKYQQLTQNAVDSELVAQMKLSSAMICSAFHVPAYKVGVGDMPSYDNAEILNQVYYDDCLHTILRGVETLLDDGLGLLDVVGHTYHARFDLDGLLRMDSTRQIDALNKMVGAGWMKPNEARAKRNMKPVKGGDTPYLQMQNWPLQQLAERPTPSATQTLLPPAEQQPGSSTAPPPAEPPPAKAIDSFEAMDMSELSRELELEPQ